MKLEQIERLRPYEKSLKQSMHDYISVPTKESKEVVYAVYKELFNQVANDNHGCNSCVLKIYKRVAEEYFKPMEPEPIEIPESVINELLNPSEKEVVEKPKRTYNRKPKEMK